MSILCPYCPDNAEMPLARYDAHITQKHPELIENHALMAIQTTEQQVAYVYEKHPEAMKDNGMLISYILRAYPKLACTSTAGTITITAKFADFAYFLKHTASITRLGRHIRRPAKNGTAIAQQYSDPLPLPIKDAVRLAMESDPSARYNEGFLCQAIMRRWPVQGAQMLYADGIITLTCPKAQLPEILRRLDTITRRSREVRAKLAYTDSAVAQKRQIEYGFSTGYWRQEASEASSAGSYMSF